MIINSIKLKNFRSYEEEIEFSFTPIENKNIVLIGGENGAGKSTLFEAIKLCLYGPTAYGYQGQNSNYIAKIKSNINHNAYKEESIDAYVSISITIPEGTEENVYKIMRKWTFEEKKLVESYIVEKNDQLLTNDKVNYFDNYLKSLIPPKLFDFFFFDGEELSDSFIGRSSSSHLKESILQLCNYDTLDTLKKFLLQFQRNTAATSDETRSFEEEYRLASEELETNRNTLKTLEDDLEIGKTNLDSLYVQKENLDLEFKNSGGLLEYEKRSLIARESLLENERDGINQFIKDFCNGTLPFLLNHQMLSMIKAQVYSEDALLTYNNIKDKLNETVLKEALIETNIIGEDQDNISVLPSLILNKMFDPGTLSNTKAIFQLSNDDKSNVLSAIDSILNSRDELNNSIKRSYTRLDEIAKELKVIRGELASSTSESVLEEYLKNSAELNSKILIANNNINNLTARIEAINSDIAESESNFKKLKNQYVQSMQSNKTLKISNNLVETIDEILFELTKNKIHEIENNFILIFKELIRKDTYVDSIEINKEFESTLYINKEYSSIEIYNLINNIGFDEIERKYGTRFIDDLKLHYNAQSKKDLVENIKNNLRFENLLLRTKFNLNDFSKGEKQIYILSLVWALIKSSGVQIPFVIDTPYGRIDATHRDTLTTKYLPNISKQVIVLSTNKEIDEKLHSTIKDYVCNEYLLKYIDNERKTKVLNGYFFEV